MPFNTIFKSKNKDSDSVRNAFFGKKEKPKGATRGNFLQTKMFEEDVITKAPAPVKNTEGDKGDKDDAKETQAVVHNEAESKGEEEMKQDKEVTASAKGKQREQEGGVKKAQEDQAHRKDKIYETQIRGTFAKLWHHYKNQGFNDVKLDETSFYTPNAISIFEMLFAMHDCLYRNEYQRWEYRDYMSFPVTIYYSVLYYIRILDILEKNNELPKELGSTLRDFFRKYPKESLPIAGPLWPLFEGLAGYKSEDDRLQLLLPAIPIPFKDGLFANPDETIEYKDFILTQPNIPLLVGFWRSYCTETPDNMRRTGHAINDDFVPFKFENIQAGTKKRFGNHVFAPTAPNTQELRMEEGFALYALGLDRTHPERWRDYDTNYDYWKSSAFARARMPFSDTATADSTTQKEFATMAEFLCMSRGAGWFTDCVRAATIQAKFFEDPYYLSDSVWSSGPQVNIRTHLYVNDSNAGRDVYSSHEIPDDDASARESFVVWTGEGHTTDSRTWFRHVRQHYSGELFVVENHVSQVEKYGARALMMYGPVTYNAETGEDQNLYTSLTRVGNRYFRGPYFHGYTYRVRGGTAQSQQTFSVHAYSSERFSTLDRMYQYVSDNHYVSGGIKG